MKPEDYLHNALGKNIGSELKNKLTTENFAKLVYLLYQHDEMARDLKSKAVSVWINEGLRINSIKDFIESEEILYLSAALESLLLPLPRRERDRLL